MELSKIVAVVSGGASGLGRAVVERLCAAGARIGILDLNENDAKTLVAKAPDQIALFKCDVSKAEQVESAVAEVFARWSRLDLSVACAGVGPAERFLSREGAPHSEALFRKVIEVNLMGTFHLNRSAAAAMAKSPALTGQIPGSAEKGLLIQVASVAAFEGQIGQAAYAASKGAIVSMTLPLARDLSKIGIRVVTIAPGIFETPMLMGMPQEVRDSLGKQVPFPSRLGKPEEFAQLVQSIAENPMLNGCTIRLDGAIRMQPK